MLAFLSRQIRGVATGRIIGKVTAGTGRAEELTPAQTRTVIELTTKAQFNAAISDGDIVYLDSADTIAAAKTFLDTTMKLRNVANTFDGSFVNSNTANRIYTLKDAAGTVAFVADITGTNSGTNTGDQTITLTGGVTGSGSGSFAATVATNANLTGPVTSTGNATAIADGALALAKLANGTAGNVVTYSAAGVITVAATGTAAQVLTSNGAGAAPTFQAAASGMSIGGSITSATAGSMLFAGVSGVLAQDNANIFWDDTNNRLGIGTVSPSAKLHIAGATAADHWIVGGGATGNYSQMVFGETPVVDGAYGEFVRFSNATAATPGTWFIANKSRAIVFATVGNSPYTDDLHISATGLVGINTAPSGAQLHLKAGAASTIGLILQGAASQSASLQEWRNSAAAILGNVTSDCRFGFGAAAATYQGLIYGASTSYLQLANSATTTGATNGFQFGLEADKTMNLIQRENAAVNFWTNGIIRWTMAAAGGVTLTKSLTLEGSANNRAVNNRILYGATTDAATAVELTTDGAAGSGSTNRIAIPNNTSLSIVLNISVKQSASASAKQMLRQVVISNNAGVVAIQGTVIALGTDSGTAGLATVTCTITANDTDDCLKVEVNGVAVTNLRYTCFVVSAETLYA